MFAAFELFLTDGLMLHSNMDYNKVLRAQSGKLNQNLLSKLTLVSVFFFYKEVNAFNRQGCIKLPRSDSKNIYNVISNKCCSFKLSIHQRIIKACIMVFKAKILGSKNCFQH